MANNASAATIGDRSRQKCRILFDVKNAVADHDTQKVGVQADFGAACRKEFVLRRNLLTRTQPIVTRTDVS